MGDVLTLDFNFNRDPLSESEAPLRQGGGGGTYDGMLEERVARLEEDMKEVRTGLTALRIDVAEIKGHIGTSPTTSQFADLVATGTAVKAKVESLPTAAQFADLSASNAAVKAKLDSLPTAAQFTELSVAIGNLKTKVEGLPSMAKLSTLVVMIGALWVLMPKIQATILYYWP